MPDATAEITATEWLTESGPTTEEEAGAAARALIGHRRQERAVAALSELSEFERELAERAYMAGTRHALNAVHELVGPAAVTVDAAALRTLEVRHHLRFEEGSHDVMRGRYPDTEAAELVLRTLEAVESRARRTLEEHQRRTVTGATATERRP